MFFFLGFIPVVTLLFSESRLVRYYLMQKRLVTVIFCYIQSHSTLDTILNVAFRIRQDWQTEFTGVEQCLYGLSTRCAMGLIKPTRKHSGSQTKVNCLGTCNEITQKKTVGVGNITHGDKNISIAISSCCLLSLSPQFTIFQPWIDVIVPEV